MKLVNVCNLVIFFVLISMVDSYEAFGAKFDNYEIRVIRPKSFTKRKKFELGVSTGPVVGQTFINTFLIGADLTYHVNEQFGLEFSGVFGASLDKEDKRILKEDFEISTLILRTQYMMNASVLYAPIYGKYQLTSGKLIYFDTFLVGGVGTTGIQYLYDQCVDPEDVDPLIRDQTPAIPAEGVVSYPSIILGIGQRYFISKKDTIKWNVRMNAFSYNTGDGACDQVPADDKSNQEILMSFGLSRYF